MGVTRIEHPSYFGYRAQRSAGGEVRYKYFSLAAGAAGGKNGKISANGERRARLAAEAYDRELADWQSEIHIAHLKKSIPIRKTNNTGVRGITFRRRYRAVKRGRTYKYPVFQISVLKPDGRSLMRRVRVREGEERAAWRAACDCLAAVKSVDAKALYRRFPKELFE